MFRLHYKHLVANMGEFFLKLIGRKASHNPIGL